MLINNAVLTGSFSVNGTDVTYITGSNLVSASFQALSSSYLATSASYVITSGSYAAASSSLSVRVTNNESTGSTLTSASASFATMSGSLSTRVTKIEGNYATTGSNSFSGSQNITGSLTVSSQIVAQTLNVQQVTSSIVYSSGSNVFGNQLTDVQQFTGSLRVTGSGNNYFLGGNVGIGTTSPASYAGYTTLAVNNNTNGGLIDLLRNGTRQFSILTDATYNYLYGATDLPLVLYTNATPRIYISGSNGNVGIGTTSPNNLLDIATPITNALYGFSMSYSGTAVGVYQVNNATGELKFGGAAAGYFPTFYAGGSERMRITSGGNVGIGTTSPTTKLTINGSADIATNNIDITGNSSTGAKGHIGMFANGLYLTSNYYYNGSQNNDTGSLGQVAIVLGPGAGGDNGIAFSLSNAGATQPTAKMFVSSSGNVGIGVTAAQSTLEINGGSTYFPSKVLTLSGAENTRYNGFIGLNLIAGSQLAMSLGTRSNNTDYANTLNLYQGNVGIGTTSPSFKLHVVGGNFNQAILDNAGEQYTALDFRNNGTTKTDFYYDNTNTAFNIRTRVAGPLILSTNDTERMRITSAGDIRIGPSTTSSQWYFNYNNTNNKGGISINYSTGEYQIWTGESGNGYYQTFYTNGSERMRITSGGKVQINSPSDTGPILSIKGGDNNWTIGTAGTSTTGQSYGILITAGTNSTDSSFYVQNAAGNTQYFRIRGDGYIYATQVYVNTTATAANVVVTSGGDLIRSTSSIKYKKNVSDYTKGLAEVMSLRPVNYQGKNEIDGDKVFAGLIAEEVHDAGLTEFVQYAEDGSPDALAYQNMVALLINAIKELKAENDALKLRIENLESK